MFRKQPKGWLKHWDFMLLDIIVLQLSFAISWWIRFGFGNPYGNPRDVRLALIFGIAQLLGALFTDCYKNILHRGYLVELIQVFKLDLHTVVFVIIYLYLVHEAGAVSRILVGVTGVVFLVLSYGAHLCLKTYLIHRKKTNLKGKHALVLITTRDAVEEALQNLYGEGVVSDVFVRAIILLDWVGEVPGTIEDIPCHPYSEDILQEIRQAWVDEVLILQTEGMRIPVELIDGLQDMGITIHYNLPVLNEEQWEKPMIQKIGRYKVITNSVRFVSPGQALVKRLVDILGGVVGCILTGIIFLFIAPAIYIKSPGPIFFSQERIGKNGKVFRMYKFRSMYMDAEARRAELMEQNKIESGLIFKMDDDPRIIGSEKKDKNGKPKGIGNFIRNTSLDEFPQFWNVLKGDMSLVGTRPPTKDEWEKYDLKHRIRMSVKPGITGIWQVSGRSEITDFDEIVRMDKEYINEWDLALDFKILVKTVVVVLTGHGAE